MIRQFVQNQRCQQQQKQSRHNMRHYNQIRKQTQWNMNGLSVLKRSPSISLNKSTHKRKISLSNIKKLKQSKKSHPVQKIFNGNKISSQNIYPTYQYNYSRNPMLKNVIPILEENPIYSQRRPQPFKASNSKQINQNLTYCRNTIQQKSTYFSQNCLYPFERIKSVQKISPLTFKESKPKHKEFCFPQSNRNLKFVNSQIKSSIKQKQLSAEMATINNQNKLKSKQVKYKTQAQQMGFRRTQSFGSDNQQDNDGVSIVLEHYPIEQIQQNKVIQQCQTSFAKMKEQPFNKYVKSIFHN